MDFHYCYGFSSETSYNTNKTESFCYKNAKIQIINAGKYYIFHLYTTSVPWLPYKISEISALIQFKIENVNAGARTFPISLLWDLMNVEWHI